MKEQIISFETAKLAKEKGFDWETYTYYMVVDSYELTNIKYDKLNYNTCKDNWNRKAYDSDYSSAPTQSLLQKWLRDKHNIIALVLKPADYIGTVDGTIFAQGGLNGTYEEVLEKILLKSLKKID